MDPRRPFPSLLRHTVLSHVRLPRQVVHILVWDPQHPTTLAHIRQRHQWERGAAVDEPLAVAMGSQLHPLPGLRGRDSEWKGKTLLDDGRAVVGDGMGMAHGHAGSVFPLPCRTIESVPS